MSGGGSSTTRWLSNGSISITIDGMRRPVGWAHNSIPRTVPVTGACWAVEINPSGAAIIWPRRTRMPGPTSGREGAPVC